MDETRSNIRQYYTWQIVITVIAIIAVIMAVAVAATKSIEKKKNQQNTPVAQTPVLEPASPEQSEILNNSSTSIQTSPGAVTTVNVGINNFSFGSDILQVSPETTVIWTNKDSVDHTVTSESGIFDSGVIKPGEKFQYKFDNIGSFPYRCTLHPNMKSTVIIK